MGTAPKDPKVIASPKGRGNPYASKQGKFGFLRRKLLAMTKNDMTTGTDPKVIASPKGRGNPYASKQGKYGLLRRRLLAMTKK